MKSKYLPGVIAISVAVAILGLNQQATAATKTVSVQEFKALQDKVKKLETLLQQQSVSANSVLIPEAYSDLLGSECGRGGMYEKEYNINGKRFFQCRFKFVVSK